MAFIRTMLGDIAPEKLGFTYSHEHIVCRPQHWVDRNADDLLLDDPAKSQQEVALFRDAGGRSLVDATAVDYGRDPAAVREISRDRRADRRHCGLQQGLFVGCPHAWQDLHL